MEAHIRFREWTNELDRLKEKRDQLERDIEPLQQAVNATTNAAQDAIMGKAYWAAAIQNPFTSEMAQNTQCYIQYRLPELTEVAVAGDRDNPEYRQCLKLARLLALATGFRTCTKCGGEDNLPDDRTLMLTSYDEYHHEKLDDAASRKPLLPDVLDAQRTLMERAAEDHNHHDKLEDLRGVKLPRNLRVPDYKRTEDVRELLRPR